MECKYVQSLYNHVMKIILVLTNRYNFLVRKRKISAHDLKAENVVRNHAAYPNQRVIGVSYWLTALAKGH